MTLAALLDSDDGIVQVLLALLGVIQTIALAVIADRSRRVRQYDRRSSSSDQSPPTT